MRRIGLTISIRNSGGSVCFPNNILKDPVYPVRTFRLSRYFRFFPHRLQKAPGYASLGGATHSRRQTLYSKPGALPNDARPGKVSFSSKDELQPELNLPGRIGCS